MTDEANERLSRLRGIAAQCQVNDLFQSLVRDVVIEAHDKPASERPAEFANLADAVAAFFEKRAIEEEMDDPLTEPERLELAGAVVVFAFDWMTAAMPENGGHA